MLANVFASSEMQPLCKLQFLLFSISFSFPLLLIIISEKHASTGYRQYIFSFYRQFFRYRQHFLQKKIAAENEADRILRDAASNNFE